MTLRRWGFAALIVVFAALVLFVFPPFQLVLGEA